LKAALGLATCLVKLGEPRPAMRWAQRALSIDPRNAAARVAMGDAHLAAGDARLAEAEWREALVVDPGNGEALLRLNKLTSRTP
jgi:Tfp pilus assembly protein PilF